MKQEYSPEDLAAEQWCKVDFYPMYEFSNLGRLRNNGKLIAVPSSGFRYVYAHPCKLSFNIKYAVYNRFISPIGRKRRVTLKKKGGGFRAENLLLINAKSKNELETRGKKKYSVLKVGNDTPIAEIMLHTQSLIGKQTHSMDFNESQLSKAIGVNFPPYFMDIREGEVLLEEFVNFAEFVPRYFIVLSSEL